MLLSALLIGGTIIGVGSLIAAFWTQIRSWLVKILEKLRTVVKGAIEGVRIIFSRIGSAIKEISKNYAKVGTEWQETVVERTVELSEIPEEYRQRLQIEDKQYEFTEELQNQLTQD